MPVINAVVALIVAIDVAPLDQVPPVGLYVGVIELPMHNPEYAAPTQLILAVKGLAATETVAIALQEPDVVYVILTVPAATPVTIPVDEPTVAVPVALLVHVPPNVASLRVIAFAVQRLLDPLIAEGTVLTVTSAVT